MTVWMLHKLGPLDASVAACLARTVNAPSKGLSGTYGGRGRRVSGVAEMS